MYDIVIIGAGTAGLSAAVYAVRSGKSALCIDEMSYGGQIVVSPEVENYPGISSTSGFEFAEGLYNQAKNLGTEFLFDRVKEIKDGKVKKVITDSKEIECKAIIIATGAKNRMLGIPNEEALIGKGVSYCATCDGAFYRGKVTAVNGGGNTAIEDAMFLTDYCEKVYLIHRRDSFRAEKKETEKLKSKDNLELVLDSVIESINGQEKLQSVTVKNVKTGRISEILIDGLFVAIGQAPRNDIFREFVDIDDKGYIIAGEDCRTKTDGIFVAGDCRTKAVRQLVTAAADGAVAALMACEFINN